jgi:hypothetical protein
VVVAAAQVGPFVRQEGLALRVTEAAQHPAGHDDPSGGTGQRERLRGLVVDHRQFGVSGNPAAFPPGPQDVAALPYGGHPQRYEPRRQGQGADGRDGQGDGVLRTQRGHRPVALLRDLGYLREPGEREQGQ